MPASHNAVADLLQARKPKKGLAEERIQEQQQSSKASAKNAKADHVAVELQDGTQDRASDSSSSSSSSSADSEASNPETRDECALEGVAWEMRDLARQFERLPDTYKLVDRLGEGTFSAVYKAQDLRHHQFDNSAWCRHCREPKQLPAAAHTSSQHESPATTRTHKRKRSAAADTLDEDDKLAPKKSVKKMEKIYVAIKRIYVTSSPQRIENEIELLNRLRGHPNVANLITAFRHEDQVLAVMPYEKHADFREFYRTLTLDKVRDYMRCMLAGMAWAHSKNIIHRDVKPANFLFNPVTGHGTLCDFGLAEKFDPQDWHAKCLHSLPCAELGLPHGRLMSKPRPLMRQLEEQLSKWQKLAEQAHRKKQHIPKAPWMPPDDDVEMEISVRDEDNDDFYQSWEPTSRTTFGTKKGRSVGYVKPENDRRPNLRANRAGTRGFRAPEVLFKCMDQTIAIDIWSVGVTLLCLLSRRFPFFASNDDTEALMEISAIFGKKKMETCAAMHNRSFVTNVPSVTDHEHNNLHNLILALNPRIFEEHTPPTFEFASDESEDAKIAKWYTTSSPLFQAVDLMRKMLAVDCTRRISAQDALDHPFFTATQDVD